jgi:hypothetical protein
MSAAVRPWVRLRPDRGTYRLLTLGAARGLASIMGFAALLVVARALSPEQLGLWSLALAVQGYALHFAEFGLRSAVTAEAACAGAACRRCCGNIWACASFSAWPCWPWSLPVRPCSSRTRLRSWA